MKYSIKFGIVAIFVLTIIIAGVFLIEKKEKKQSMIPIEIENEKIGWITDLHTDNIQEMDGGESGTLYPEKAEEYFSSFLRQLEKEKIETVIVTGDNVHEGKIKYAQKLKEIEKKYPKVKVLWVKGNHDREKDKIMETLGVEDPYYYVYDTKSMRIIVLNLRDGEKSIDTKQLSWIREKLAETNLPVIVAMHMPIVDYAKQSIFPQFENLELVMQESGKVKFFISGSLHQEKKLNLNGIFYQTAYPLTHKDYLGNYYIINMDDDRIDNFNIIVE